MQLHIKGDIMFQISRKQPKTEKEKTSEEKIIDFQQQLLEKEAEIATINYALMMGGLI